MVPWNRITCLQFSTDLRTLSDRVVKDHCTSMQHSLPDQIVGVLYTKDLLAVGAERARAPPRRCLDLAPILHQPRECP